MNLVNLQKVKTNSTLLLLLLLLFFPQPRHQVKRHKLRIPTSYWASRTWFLTHEKFFKPIS